MTSPQSRSGKRLEILAAATERFGRDGYEDTKWADIATDVGVGPTALYHYFESKQHCLFVIMADAIESFHERFASVTVTEPDVLSAVELARAMERGAVPESDPRLLARAVLGLYNSIWQWYRPDGVVTLESVSAFYRSRLLQVIGFDAGSPAPAF